MTERPPRWSVYGLNWALIGAAPAIAIVACDTPPPVVAAEATTVCRRLAANAPRRVDAVGDRVESVCDVTLTSTWPTFLEGARAALSPAYRVVAEENESATLRQVLDADVYTIHLRSLTERPRAVRVTFTAEAW
jgi:hypothetical protein